MIAHWLSLPLAAQAIAALWLLAAFALAALGLHRLALVRWARRAPAPPEPPPLPDPLPLVTVQLPLYNERFVAERILQAAAGLDWPRERIEIQVLDDSTDETRAIVAGATARLRREGFRVSEIRRSGRPGFKAGALAEGMRAARGELVAIFDADFLPPPDFLRRTVPHFHDPAVGMVQARWGHLDRGHSLLTEIQALMLDGHFAVEHAGRAGRGSFFNFNGTAGVWRRSAIEAAGGWQADTLTEDLDLSYRAQLAGARFVYLPSLEVAGELPAAMAAFKSQQARWTRGSAQTARKLVGPILRASLPGRVKRDALFHLLGNLGWLPLFAVAVLSGAVLELRDPHRWTQTLFLDLPLLALGTLATAAFYAPVLRAEGGARRAWLLAALMGLGAGMSFHNARAALAGLLLGPGEFRRTPKAGFARGAANGYRPETDRGYLVELGLALGFTGLLLRALLHGLYLSAPFFALFACGFAFTGLLSRPRPRDPACAARSAPRTSPGTSS